MHTAVTSAPATASARADMSATSRGPPLASDVTSATFTC